MSIEALRARALWITVVRAVVDGRTCREHRVLSSDGDVLLEMRAWPWRRDMVVRRAHADPLMVLRRRRSFPLSGKVDVIAQASGERIGVVTRSGRFRGEAGRGGGRFRDARSLRRRSGEALLEGAVDALLGGESAGIGAGPSGFVYVTGDRVVGTLARARPPFEEGAAAAETGKLARFIPGRVRAWARRRGSAWKLVRTAEDPNDPLLVIAAALFAVELSYW